MTTNARLILIIPVLLAAIGGSGIAADSARAEENCLAAPNRQAPHGSHWYYHLDRVKQSKCWYLRAEGPVVQKAAAQDGSSASDAASSPAATAKIARDRAVEKMQQRLEPIAVPPAASSGKRTQASDENPVLQPKADAVTWPEPSSPPAASMAWPDPPSPARSAAPNATAVSDPAETVQSAQDLPPTAAMPDESAPLPDRADGQVVEPGRIDAPARVMPASIILAGAIGLAVAGIVLHLIVRMTFAWRQTIHVEGREPDWVDSIARERRAPEFAAQPSDFAAGEAYAAQSSDFAPRADAAQPSDFAGRGVDAVQPDCASGWVDGERVGDEVQQTRRIFARLLDPEVA